jgi:hypothetical protein
MQYLIIGFEPINIGLTKMTQAGGGMIDDGACVVRQFSRQAI